MRTAVAISLGASPSGRKNLFTKEFSPTLLPRKSSPAEIPRAARGTPGTKAALRTTPPITGSKISPAALKLAPSTPSLNLFRSRTADSSLPVKVPSSSV